MSDGTDEAKHIKNDQKFSKEELERRLKRIYEQESRIYDDVLKRYFCEQIAAFSTQLAERELEQFDKEQSLDPFVFDPFGWVHRRACSAANCTKKCLPYSRYCLQHILLDQKQKLYEPRIIEGSKSNGCCVTSCNRVPLSRRIMRRFLQTTETEDDPLFALAHESFLEPPDSAVSESESLDIGQFPSSSGIPSPSSSLTNGSVSLPMTQPSFFPSSSAVALPSFNEQRKSESSCIEAPSSFFPSQPTFCNDIETEHEEAESAYVPPFLPKPPASPTFCSLHCCELSAFSNEMLSYAPMMKSKTKSYTDKWS
ncbi:uncharacterized protein MONOS_17721 [Monocercomonoides exilis]|uniref:uncharacterized protein n=1 Tax=Monocercomonoides exilis TaxID=2049356 RepID=UPI00355A8641|nr:hypothetical protein MONOS_17721 [Monocercomonoides exilis]